MPLHNGEEAEAEHMGEEYFDEDTIDADIEIENDMYSLDTTAAQARNGKDIQGIQWALLGVIRENHRKSRLQNYKNFEDIPNSGEASGKDCINSEKGSSFYMFKKNFRSVRSTILHFQVSTLAVKDGMVVAGGFCGELICKLDKPGVSFCYRTTCKENAITNVVDIHRNSSGALHFMASSNDGGVRNFDMERYQLVQQFHYSWPVNHSSVSPDGKLVAVVGDDPDGLLVDSNNGVGKLYGHLDYSFAWHPNGVTFAMGNQDKTCRVWDLRNLSKSVAVLKGNLGAIRSIRFTSDGQYMAMAVPADFVHIYNTNIGFMKKQEIGFFGEISGISFSPNTKSLFIGI